MTLTKEQIEHIRTLDDCHLSTRVLQELCDMALLSLQEDKESGAVVYGPEKQDYPGGPIYRVGTSTGAYLPEQPSPPPPAHRWVPVEPTEEMLLAAQNAGCEGEDDALKAWGVVWKAMIAAAPSSGKEGQ